MKSIFEYTKYQEYLTDRLGGAGRRTGQRSAAARALGCHTTYISQVLTERVHMNLELATELSEFLGHTEDEGHYFLLLVQFGRAGSQKLRKVIEKQMIATRKANLIIKKRLSDSESLSKEEESEFYSSWIFGAIHVLVSVPSLRTADALANHLSISIREVKKSLKFLELVGMVKRRPDKYKDKYEVGPTHVHLGSDSPNISKHHTNWRIQALSSFDRRTDTDLHYSAVVSLSKQDAFKLRESILKNLENNVSIIGQSESEEAFVYCFDFFRLAGK